MGSAVIMLVGTYTQPTDVAVTSVAMATAVDAFHCFLDEVDRASLGGSSSSDNSIGSSYKTTTKLLGSLVVGCLDGVGVLKLACAVCHAAWDPALDNRPTVPLAWSSLMRAIVAGQRATGSGPWSKPFMRWGEFAEHAKALGFNGTDGDSESSLRCAAAYLDTVGAVFYKGRATAVARQSGHLNASAAADTYVLLRPQVGHFYAARLLARIFPVAHTHRHTDTQQTTRLVTVPWPARARVIMVHVIRAH